MNLMSIVRTSRKSQIKGQVRSLIAAGDAARDQRSWMAAAAAYGKALELDPARMGIWVQLGHARKESGDLNGAETAYLKALSLSPEAADTHLQLGFLRKLQGRLDQAADNFLRAAELDPDLPFALDELTSLGGQGVAFDTARASAVARRTVAVPALPTRSSSAGDLTALMDDLLRRLEAKTREDNQALIATLQRGVEAAQTLTRDATETTSGAGRTHLVFDISDLVGYFGAARLPTGIQRVQIEVISALLATPRDDVDVAVCSFSRDRDHWVGVPPELFLHLCDLSLQSGDVTDAAWTRAVRDLKVLGDLSPAFAFPQGACLINLGTSWWLQNYFLHVRQAKDLYGIQYVPFVHDMIPIMTPEHCVKELTQDFISWALGVFAHADHFFTNSEASKKDLLAVAERLGHAVAPEAVHVVRLDADFRKPLAAAPMRQTMSRYGLVEGEYVLFVSTIESRKNHLSVFKAWQELIQKHGAARVARLICVGNRGWLNDAVFAKLEASAELRARISIVSGVSDPDLANLYRGSAFTLYPSTYEGWGLPVTESFCYGKAALLSDASSLPEAGGEFAVYFRTGDQADFVQKLDRLMFDLPYRQALEARIASDFAPRPWRDLGEEMTRQLIAWFPADRAEAAFVAPAPTLGRYYWLRRVNETAIHRGMEANERFRSGDGWWQPDDWGNWTKLKGAQLKLNLGQADGTLKFYIGLQGLSQAEQTYQITFGGVVVRQGVLRAKEERWLSIDIRTDQYAAGEIVIGLKGQAKEDFALNTNGVDRRVAGLGVFGFMICQADDLKSRADFMEALTLQQLPELAEASGAA